MILAAEVKMKVSDARAPFTMSKRIQLLNTKIIYIGLVYTSVTV